MGVGPWQGPWPTTEEQHPYDEELLAQGDRRNVVDRYRYWRHDAIVGDLDTRRHDFHVAVENWGHDFNIGSVIRTANAFNAAAFHIVGRRRWNRRGAMVTDRYQHEHHHESVAALVEWAAGQDGGLPLVGIDNLPGSVPLESYDLPRRCILLFGQEGPGLSEPAPRRRAWRCSTSPSTGPPGRSTPAPRRRWRCTPGSAGTSSPRFRPADVAAHRCPGRRPAAGPGEGVAARWGTCKDRLHARPGPSRGRLRRSSTRSSHAHRHPRGVRRHAGPREGRLLRLPGHQRLVLADAERRDPRASPRPGATASSRSPPAARSTCPGPTVKDMVTGVAGARRLRARGGQELRRQHRAAHRPLPQGQARRVRPAAARGVAPSGSRPAARPWFQSHMWDGSAVPLDENLADRPRAARRLAKAANVDPRDRGRRRRRRGGRRRERDRRQALLHARGRASPPSRRSAPARTAAT